MDAAENVKPSKKLARERIDLAVALIMSLDSAVVGESKPASWGWDEMFSLYDAESQDQEQPDAAGG